MLIKSCDETIMVTGGDKERAYGHYWKDVRDLDGIDVYRVLTLFNVSSPAVGHAIKKSLCAGQRGGKSYRQDIVEAIDALNRELEMLEGK